MANESFEELKKVEGNVGSSITTFDEKPFADYNQTSEGSYRIEAKSPGVSQLNNLVGTFEDSLTLSDPNEIHVGNSYVEAKTPSSPNSFESYFQDSISASEPTKLNNISSLLESNIPDTLQTSGSGTMVDNSHVQMLQNFEEGNYLESKPLESFMENKVVELHPNTPIQTSSGGTISELKPVDTLQTSGGSNFQEARVVDNTLKTSGGSDFQEARVVDNTLKTSGGSDFQEARVVDNTLKTSGGSDFQEARVVNNTLKTSNGGNYSEATAIEMIQKKVTDTIPFKDTLSTSIGNNISELHPNTPLQTSSGNTISELKTVDTLRTATGNKITELKSPAPLKGTANEKLVDYIKEVKPVNDSQKSILDGFVNNKELFEEAAINNNDGKLRISSLLGGSIQQAKYGVISPNGGYTMIDGISGIQAKYGVLPPGTPIENFASTMQAKYGVISPEGGYEMVDCISGIQAKYGVPSPEILVEGFGAAQQAKYGVMCPIEPGPYPELNKIEMIQFEDMPDTKEIRDTRDFADELGSLLKDLDKFNENSSYISGPFGQAMTYSSDVCKEDMELLKRYTVSNFAHAMNAVSDYDSNVEALKNCIEPVAGSFSMSNFTADGTYMLPEGVGGETSRTIQETAGKLYQTNKSIKQKVDLLSEEKIN